MEGKQVGFVAVGRCGLRVLGIVRYTGQLLLFTQVALDINFVNRARLTWVFYLRSKGLQCHSLFARRLRQELLHHIPSLLYSFPFSLYRTIYLCPCVFPFQMGSLVAYQRHAPTMLFPFLTGWLQWSQSLEAAFLSGGARR